MADSDGRSSWKATIAFVVWSAVIIAATAPWSDFVGHTHWRKVQWVPFRSPPVKAIDVVVNVFMYLPFGYAWRRASGRRARLWHAPVLAFALSLSLEWSQLYSHLRFPSLQDVLCDVCGAWVGGWLGARRPATSESAALMTEQSTGDVDVTG